MLRFHSQYSELKNGIPVISKKNLDFCFKDKLLKTFKIPSDYHIKHADLLNGRLY